MKILTKHRMFSKETSRELTSFPRSNLPFVVLEVQRIPLSIRKVTCRSCQPFRHQYQHSWEWCGRYHTLWVELYFLVLGWQRVCQGARHLTKLNWSNFQSLLKKFQRYPKMTSQASHLDHWTQKQICLTHLRSFDACCHQLGHGCCTWDLFLGWWRGHCKYLPAFCDFRFLWSLKAPVCCDL